MLDAARARVGSYRNRLCVIEPDRDELPVELLRDAVRAGLADAAEHLGSGSDSFGLEAWRKWARMMTGSAAKAWPRVFASGRGLAGALLSTYEGIQPVGFDGGHLRGVYADFLDEAAALLEEPSLADGAAAWREAAALWQALADLALPEGRLRELLAEVHGTVVEGGDAAAPAAELWELRRSLDERLRSTLTRSSRRWVSCWRGSTRRSAPRTNVNPGIEGGGFGGSRSSH